MKSKKLTLIMAIVLPFQRCMILITRCEGGRHWNATIVAHWKLSCKL